jgi:hypothetical protein
VELRGPRVTRISTSIKMYVSCLSCQSDHELPALVDRYLNRLIIFADWHLLSDLAFALACVSAFNAQLRSAFPSLNFRHLCYTLLHTVVVVLDGLYWN